MTLELHAGRHSWTMPSGTWGHGAPFAGLGIPPLIIGAIALSAAAASIGAWLASPAEDWSDNKTFKDRARRLHTEMLGVQCAVGGAINKDIRTLDGQLLCAKGTKSDCTPPKGLMMEWQGFLSNFASFWRTAESRTFGPNDSDAGALRKYVEDTHKFVLLFKKNCSTLSAQVLPEVPKDEGTGIPWSWILGGGIGILAVLTLLRTPAAPIVIRTSEALERGARRAGSALRRRF